jgi:diamine N-acetyltransferase
MIVGQTIALRPLERRHMERTRAWANDPELMRLMDRARSVSQEEHERWFAALGDRRDCVYFAIETNNDARHIGNVWLWGIDRRHGKAELRIVIGEQDSLGRGLGTEAISLLCSYAFERLSLHKLYAYTLAINPRARRAFEKAGFIVEGTLREDRIVDGRYIDVYLLGRLREIL